MGVYPRLYLFNADDEWFGPVVEVYEDTEHLGTIAYHFDRSSPAYYFVSRDGREERFLCWQDDEDLAVKRFERRYYAARRRMGL